jgi:hypothetical protein
MCLEGQSNRWRDWSSTGFMYGTIALDSLLSSTLRLMDGNASSFLDVMAPQSRSGTVAAAYHSLLITVELRLKEILEASPCMRLLVAGLVLLLVKRDMRLVCSHQWTFLTIGEKKKYHYELSVTSWANFAIVCF